MKFVLFTVMILLVAVPAFADEFLKKSKILNDNHVNILVGENQKNAVVLHVEDLPNGDKNAFLLTSKGAVPLKDKSEKMHLLGECTGGEPYPGIGFIKAHESGFLVAVGAKAASMLTWYPSVKNEAPGNFACDVGQTRNAVSEIFGLVGLPQKLFRTKWTRHLTHGERKAECLAFANWNAEWKLKEKELRPENVAFYVNGAITDCMSWPCADRDRVSLGIIFGAGQCKVTMRSEMDCNGKASEGIWLEEFLGILKVQSGNLVETWFIWDAPGYEGEGIYAVEEKDLEKKDKLSEEWLVYNGC